MVKKYFFVLMLFSVILISFTGCLFDFGKEIPQSNNVEPSYEQNYGTIYLDEYPDYSTMTNLLFYDDFDTHSSSKKTIKNVSYTGDEIFARWNNNPSRAPSVLTDKHGKVCKLNGTGAESSLQFSVNVSEKSVLNFQIKSDMYFDDVLRLSIDNKTYKVPHKGHGEAWKKVSIGLNVGNHNIKIFIPKQSKYSPQLKNAIYIDNISVVPDKVEFIDIYPKGLQETYVDGMPIKFNAVPLRGDKSVIANKNVIYSVSGCGSIDSNGVFRPTGEGECTVTATIDGKSVYKTDIKVHGKHYLSDPVTIGNHTFTGKISSKSGNAVSTGSNIRLDSAFSPITDTFCADGFFVLKGRTDVPIYIQVVKNDNNGNPDNNYKTSYFVRKPGSFYKRIWLRFGTGTYTVFITEAPNMQFYNTNDSRFEGDLITTGRCPVVERLFVTNTNNISFDDAVWLMPSELVQSDSFYVSNMANAILAGLPSGASTGDKLRAFHDWELYNHHYDMASVNHNGQRRKRQDAEHVVKYGMGVCEGYANLYAALLRKAGIPAKMIGSTPLMHAWNHVYYDVDRKWYLVDVTWDDPVTDNSDTYNDRAVGRENYTYFMTAQTDSNVNGGGHTDAGQPDSGRTAVTEETLPPVTGIPEGWY